MRRLMVLALLLAPGVFAALPASGQAAGQPAAAPPAARAPVSPWGQYPRMVLERTYAGPLQDTIIQRWRDPIDGTVCFVYLPAVAQHSAPTASGFVQYGANTVGSISCVPAAAKR